MSGLYTNGLNNLLSFSGLEQSAWDTQIAAGAAPQSGSANLIALAAALDFYNQISSKTMVSGTIYYIGPYTIAQAIGGNDVIIDSSPQVLNGVNVKMGGTGGTDLWGVGLYNSAGVLVASSNNSGVTAGVANTWFQLPFYSGSANTPFVCPPGVYYIGIQSNGTTATLGTYNAPTFPLFTGSKTGSFFNVTTITPPTTYTASLGPKVFLY